MDLYTKLSTCMEELSATFSSRMAQYEEDLKNAGTDAATHKSIASLSREFTEFKGLIWQTMGALKTQVELLLVAVDRHEMASRSKVLLLHGLTGKDDTEPTKHFVNILSNKLNMPNVTLNNITSCHYLGSNVNKPRPLLVRFESRLLRGQVWQNKAKLKGTGLTLFEFLTKPRHEVFMNARKYYGVKRCWTSDGKIIVQVSAKSRRKLETAAELRSLMAEFPLEDSISDKAVAQAKASLQTTKATTSADKRPRKAVK